MPIDPTSCIDTTSYGLKPVWVRKLFAGKLIVTCSDVIWSYREYIWVRCSCFSHCNWHTIELTPIACYIDVFRPVGTPYRHDEGVHAIHVESCMLISMYIEVPVGASVQLQNLNFSAKWTPWSYSRGLVDAGRRKKYIDIYINKVCAGARTFLTVFAYLESRFLCISRVV